MNMRRIVAGLAVSAAIAGLAAPVAAKEQADLILHNAQVLTVDPAFSVRTAVAVRGEKILAVGGEDLLEAFTAAKVIDLKGRTLMPGFNDTHVHPKPVSPNDIAVEAATSIAEVQAMLRAKAKELGPGKWITGYGWQESNFSEKRNLSRADLDAAAPNNPVALLRAGSHSAAYNSAAFRIAKVDKSTPEPATGLIERDAGGEPSGIIRERMDVVSKFIPDPGWEAMRGPTITWLKEMLALGITSLHDASGTIDDEPLGKGGTDSKDLDPLWGGSNMTWKRAREIYATMGDQLPRITMYIIHPGAARLKAFPYHTGYGDTRLRLGAIGENAVDGGFTGPTAWLLTDYKGQPGFRGKGRFTDAELQELVDSAAKLGWQMGIHCIGDAAIVQTIKAYHHALTTIPDPAHAPADRRWFTDHFTIMPPEETMTTMAQDHVMISQQPNFLYNLDDRYAALLDDWRLAHNNAIATPVKKFGLFMAFSSDNLPIGPMVGLYAAFTRKGPSGAVRGPEEAVSRSEAIRMYTANGAYLSWEEKIKGTIEPGKLADMVVLPFDPLTAPEEMFLKGKVDMTILGGKVVYERPKS
ncbi:amidohydrolase [Novosphingobium sp. Chol11]|uniref:amidohydrolase n=1 Tax=Novosphingobium sp. Chol11 TaxID=1385763 RepID=UPI0025F9191C|nr:amidohydrolase [Novosphingobium sp. Chol11]